MSTNFPTGDRNRPTALVNPAAAAIPREQVDAMRKAVGEIFSRGATPEHAAECVYDAVTKGRFWIYTDDVHRDIIKARHRSIETGENPPTLGGALDGYREGDSGRFPAPAPVPG